MASIIIKYPDISDNIKTTLSQDYSSGTTLNVTSSSQFANGNYIVIGEPGLENTEMTSLTATPPTNTSFTIGALKFSHAKGTPVYYINWDQYELSYRTSSVGAWTAYASMPTNLSYESKYTEYRDSSATTTYEWKYRYYSTEKTAYSDYSPTISATGWPRNSVGYMVREIRKIVNDPESKTITDEEIIRFLNAAQEKIYSLYDRWWFLFKTGTNIDTVSDQKPYALPSDFGRMHTVLFNYVSGSNDLTYSLKEISIPEFDYESRDNNADADDELKYYCIYPGDTTSPTGYLRVWPKPDTAGLHITPRYYKTFTDLEDYADETEVPIPDMLENYAIARILSIRTEDSRAGTYDTMFKEQIELLKLMQRKVAKPMRSLWKYQGVNAEKRLFGNRDVYSDTDKENFW